MIKVNGKLYKISYINFSELDKESNQLMHFVEMTTSAKNKNGTLKIIKSVSHEYDKAVVDLINQVEEYTN